MRARTMAARMLSAGVAACIAVGALAAPPLAGSWSIAPTGNAASSGELLFRVTPGEGDPVEVTVNVRSGSNDVAVARDIRQALSSQLRRDRYNVQLGEGANVLVTDQRGRPNFSIELIDSDVDDLRVAVRNIEPAASPTVPAQATPANTQPASTPAQSGAGASPADNPAPPGNTPDAVPPRSAPPQNSPANPAPGGNSSPAAPPPTNDAPVTPPSAPVPNPTPNGSPSAPPPTR